MLVTLSIPLATEAQVSLSLGGGQASWAYGALGVPVMHWLIGCRAVAWPHWGQSRVCRGVRWVSVGGDGVTAGAALFGVVHSSGVVGVDEK